MESNKRYDEILNSLCAKFEIARFDSNEWSYGYELSLAFAFAEYFNNELSDLDIAEEFIDGDDDLEEVAKLRQYFNSKFDERLSNNHKNLMSNLSGGLIYA